MTGKDTEQTAGLKGGIDVSETVQQETRNIISGAFHLFADHNQRLADDLAEFTTSVGRFGRTLTVESGEPMAALYDFLYRDAGRMASDYAQIFSGRLSALEQTDMDRTSEGKGAKLDIHIASGDLKHTSETTVRPPGPPSASWTRTTS